MISVKECKFSDIEHFSKMDTEYASFAKRKKKEIWFQAIFQKQVVGCSCLLILSKQRIRLSNAFVLGGFRKNGILRTMVAEREQWAIKNKFKMIDVRSWEVDYRKFGYSLKKQYVKGAWYEKNL